jgi:hypothetical protein
MNILKILSMPDVWKITDAGRYFPLGYDFRTAEPMFIDLADTFCYSISGARRTGKTALLKHIDGFANMLDMYVDTLRETITVMNQANNDLKNILKA